MFRDPMDLDIHVDNDLLAIPVKAQRFLHRYLTK